MSVLDYKRLESTTQGNDTVTGLELRPDLLSLSQEPAEITKSRELLRLSGPFNSRKRAPFKDF